VRGVFHHPLAQRIALGAAGLAILSVVAVEPAHSQFGIDIAAILAGPKEVNSTLTSAVASPLRLIDKVEQEEAQFSAAGSLSDCSDRQRAADGDELFGLLPELPPARIREYRKRPASLPATTRTADAVSRPQ